MQGKIVKGIAGFYYVHTGKNIYECKAKGAFRKDNIKPLVGDNCIIDVIDEEKKLGNIIEILPRKSEIIRPAVANIDQALIIFAISKPEPNLNLLDRFLIMMQQKSLHTIICFNKQDIATDEEKQELLRAYEASGCQVVLISAKEGQGIDELRSLLDNKTTTVAGPSGVGKSTIINMLGGDARMETGAISEKIERGKHTTRHSQMIALDDNTYIFDTPGFSSLNMFDLTAEELNDYYPEFDDHRDGCKFLNCIHENEPHCGVKDAVEAGAISRIRYDNYRVLLKELKNKKMY